MAKVFVSGCYDMLHSGHVAFFAEAAKLGDLYVGLGSDRNIYALKGRRTINSDAERLYMVKAIRYVKDAWINSGMGLMDFEQEVDALKPDIFFVNSDGFTPDKERFCKERGIKLVVAERIPSAGLPARSTTSIRSVCRIPFRVELCGGWLDQPFVNKLCPGAVLTISIHPDHDFNERSGMATSSRNKAIELWQTELPHGDPEHNAKILFGVENPPGSTHISGSQDQLGILMPGLSKLNYDAGYWPKSIETITDDETLRFIEKHLYLMQISPRCGGYDVFANSNVNAASAKALAASSEAAWQAILAHDVKAWGAATKACFAAQLEMFPHAATQEVKDSVEKLKDSVLGWKLTGAGGGGYLILISEKPVAGTIKVHIRS